MSAYLSLKKIDEITANLLKKLGVWISPINVHQVATSLNMEIKPDNLGDDISGVLLQKDGKVIIGVNANHSDTRKRFTIAHEIGHFVLKHQRDGLFVDEYKKHFARQYRNLNSSKGTNREEIQANAFAAALLMPVDLIKKEADLILKDGNHFDLSDDDGQFISRMADKFQVSKTAMTYRIGKLNIFPA